MTLPDPLPLVFPAPLPSVPPAWLAMYGAPGVVQPLPALPPALAPWAQSAPVMPPPFVASSAKHLDVLAGSDS